MEKFVIRTFNAKSTISKSSESTKQSNEVLKDNSRMKSYSSDVNLEISNNISFIHSLPTSSTIKKPNNDIKSEKVV